MKNLKYLVILPTLALIATPVQAICPVCVVAVGAGLGLSEYLGIDDTVAGLWIGGLLVALSVWTINWLDKKNWLKKYQPLRNGAIFLIYYGAVIWPLIDQGFIGQALNLFWGLDKLLLGIAAGSLLFIAASYWYQVLKKKNHDRANFPYQKVVMPVGTLIVFSFIFYLLTR